MASPRDVRDWCRAACANYPNVAIKNMSTSFRDGLAFCAIIHHHRPDLIDFSSLCKDNVYQNNKLAFEIAERRLGIPAMLDAGDMASTKVPDGLSVITYLSRYYRFFNRKSQAGARSSHANSKTPDALKRLMSQTDLETSREVRLSNTRPATVCSVCFKPVHLIQRHLTDGKVYHRSCFRCGVCRSAVVPESYTQGSDGGSSICTHHITADSRPKCKFQAGYFSLGGLAISSVPDYKGTAESQEVRRKPEREERESKEGSEELKDRDSAVGPRSTARKPPPRRLPPSRADGTVKRAEQAGPVSALADGEMQQEETEAHGASEVSSPCAPVTGSRRMLDPSGVPVPAPRTRAAQPEVSSPSAGNSSNQQMCSSNSSQINTNPTTGKVKTNHPWMTIIHPGPWTQLPPAPPPVPAARSKSVSDPRRSWNRPRVPPPNPFGEEVEEDTQNEGMKPQRADQTEPSAAAACQRKTSGDTHAVVCTTDAEDPAIKSTPDDDGDDDKTSTNTEGFPVDVAEAAEHTQSPSLPRSLSVPAIASARPPSSRLHLDLKEANESDQVVSPQSKPACKENPFDRCDAMPKSKTLQALSCTRAPAPGHGFPLIRRKVQSDQNVCTRDLQAEMRALEKHLETLEQRGVELEGDLRGCKNDEEEDQMLMGWFSLVHERHVLMCRDTELVHLTRQQQLEERQADVEYELRCLLNKPVSDWSQEERSREQQLMDELVAIIERRNQIVSSLDQDRQREMEEDMLFEDRMKNKEMQKEELKKSKGKFKPAKMFKMLNHKFESKKDCGQKELKY